MKTKLLFLLMALLPLSTFTSDADEKELKQEIPLKHLVTDKLNRSLQEVPIESCYFGMIPSVQTVVYTNLGTVELTVTNCSTGEVWYETFDSGYISQNVLMLSGTPGFYEVTYATSSGDIYEGDFYVE